MNQLDAITGEAPIHSIVRRKKKGHTELLLALLINSDVEVNLGSRKKKTALHVALEVRHVTIFVGNILNYERCIYVRQIQLSKHVGINWIIEGDFGSRPFMSYDHSISKACNYSCLLTPVNTTDRLCCHSSTLPVACPLTL